jgi:hypothetical protein
MDGTVFEIGQEKEAAASQASGICMVMLDDTTWRVCDVSESLALDDDQVIFASDLDDAEAQLLARYPTRHRLLKRTIKRSGQWYGDGGNRAVSEMTICGERLGEVESLEELAEMFKTVDEVKVGDGFSWCPLVRELGFHKGLLDHGFVIRRRGMMTFRPGKVGSVARRHEKAQRDGERLGLIARLNAALGYGLPVLDVDERARSSFSGQIGRLDMQIVLYNACYGANSHRQLPQFTAFITRWPEFRAQSWGPDLTPVNTDAVAAWLDMEHVAVKRSRKKKAAAEFVEPAKATCLLYPGYDAEKDMAPRAVENRLKLAKREAKYAAARAEIAELSRQSAR